MGAALLTLTPLAIKYVDLAIMAAIHAAYQDVDGMTDEELEAAIAKKEAEAEAHDQWLEDKLGGT